MKKWILFVVLLIAGIKYGYDFIFSDEFQTYADKTKAPWTCKVNNFLGGFYMTMSEYKKAEDLYARVLTRCPKTPMAEAAMYHAAECFDRHSPAEARAMYEKFLQEFPKSNNASAAAKAVQRIMFSR